MPKGPITYSRRLSIKVTEEEYQLMKRIKEEAGVPYARLFREALTFYASQYLTNKTVKP